MEELKQKYIQLAYKLGDVEFRRQALEAERQRIVSEMNEVNKIATAISAKPQEKPSEAVQADSKTT